MILSLSEQSRIFLYTVAMGMAMGFFYDVIRLLRTVLRHTTLWIQAEDMLYWAICLFLVFSGTLRTGQGQMRLFLPLGIFLGGCLYFALLSRFTLSFGRCVLRFLGRLVRLIGQIVVTPFRLLWLLVGAPVKKVLLLVRKSVKKVLHFLGAYGKIKIMQHLRWSLLRKGKK